MTIIIYWVLFIYSLCGPSFSFNADTSTLDTLLFINSKLPILLGLAVTG